MGPLVLGWILIVVGLIATLAGIGGGIAKMFNEIVKEAEKDPSFGFTALPTQLFDALIKFMEALTKAPIWLALIIIGFVLITWGGSMI